MRKSRHKLESFREAVKKRPKSSRGTEQFNRADKLKILSVVAIGIGAMIITPVLTTRISQKKSIEHRLVGWTKKFGLTEEEIRLIKHLEFSFHGTGGPFSTQPAKNSPEMADHRAQLAAAVRPSIRDLFILALEKH